VLVALAGGGPFDRLQDPLQLFSRAWNQQQVDVLCAASNYVKLRCAGPRKHLYLWIWRMIPIAQLHIIGPCCGYVTSLLAPCRADDYGQEASSKQRNPSRWGV
jgi:hypothetical protein